MKDVKFTNKDVSSWMHGQVEIVLQEFAEYLDAEGFVISSLGRQMAVFTSVARNQSISFHFANMYTFGVGIQPLKDVVPESENGRCIFSNESGPLSRNG